MVGLTSYLLKVLKLEHYYDIMANLYILFIKYVIFSTTNAIDILRVTSLRPTE